MKKTYWVGLMCLGVSTLLSPRSFGAGGTCNKLPLSPDTARDLSNTIWNFSQVQTAEAFSGGMDMPEEHGTVNINYSADEKLNETEHYISIEIFVRQDNAVAVSVILRTTAPNGDEIESRIEPKFPLQKSVGFEYSVFAKAKKKGCASERDVLSFINSEIKFWYNWYLEKKKSNPNLKSTPPKLVNDLGLQRSSVVPSEKLDQFPYGTSRSVGDILDEIRNALTKR